MYFSLLFKIGKQNQIICYPITKNIYFGVAHDIF